MKTNLMKTILAVLALTGLAAGHAQADGGRHERAYFAHSDRSHQHSQPINARQDRQMERIQTGKRSGSLTRMEFRELMHEQHSIRAMERHFRADGVIDAREFHRLNRTLDIAGRNIREERHDRQMRYAYGDHPRYN